MWNSVDTELLVGDAFSVPHVVVLDSSPALSFDVALDLFGRLVDRETDESNLVAPLVLVFFKHFLVMGHWCLAWWAPGSPEVEKDNLASFMFDCGFTTAVNFACVLDGTHGGANAALHAD